MCRGKYKKISAFFLCVSRYPLLVWVYKMVKALLFVTGLVKFTSIILADAQGCSGHHGGGVHHTSWYGDQSGWPRRGGSGGAGRLARLGLGPSGPGGAGAVPPCVLHPRLVAQ